MDLQITLAPDVYRSKWNGPNAGANLLPSGRADVDSAACAIARETGGDIHGVPPDVKAKLLPADDTCYDWADMNAGPHIPGDRQPKG